MRKTVKCSVPIVTGVNRGYKEVWLVANAINKTERNPPRINLAFYDDHLDFCREQAQKQHLSVTQYVNSLIAREQAQTSNVEAEQGKGSPV